MSTNICFYDEYEESTGKSNELKIYQLTGSGKDVLCFFIGDDKNESLKKYASKIPYEQGIIIETNGKKFLIPISSYIRENINDEYNFICLFKEDSMPKTDSGVLVLCLFGNQEVKEFLKTTYPKEARNDYRIIVHLNSRAKLDYSINF